MKNTLVIYLLLFGLFFIFFPDQFGVVHKTDLEEDVTVIWRSWPKGDEKVITVFTSKGEVQQLTKEEYYQRYPYDREQHPHWVIINEEMVEQTRK